MTDRKSALILARVAGYHANAQLFTRLLCIPRISRKSLNAEWMRGADMKINSIPCECPECK